MKEQTEINDIKHFLRAQAWERAKGELNAVLATFMHEQEKFQAMSNAVDKFVEYVEDRGLAE